jgi:NTP pyrophosphatase (non-canonical NTP hydrolase)
MSITINQIETLTRDVNEYFFGDGSVSENDQLLRGLAKLSEEVGEVSEVILSLIGGQRLSKQSLSKDDLSKELADVVLACFVIADRAGVDLKQGLEKSMTKVRTRLDSMEI